MTGSPDFGAANDALRYFSAMYPEADVFTLLHVKGATSPHIDRHVKGTSWLQRFPGVHRYYRALLPLFPAASRSLDLSGYDLVISISHAAVKNVRVPPGVPHLCYCLTPMRYVWDQAATYFGNLTPLMWPLRAALQAWDRTGAAGVTRFVAISSFAAARIRCFYGRKSDVIFPPIDPFWSQAPLPDKPGEAFLYAGALVPYKRADAVVRACTMAELPLWVVGTGPEEKRLKRMAGSSVHFVGKVSDLELRDYYRRARALVFPAREDFGMIPIECMAAGRPVIALRAGATQETIRGVAPWIRAVGSSSLAASSPTGVFIGTQSGRFEHEVLDSIRFFESHETEFSPQAARTWAEQFGVRRFVEQWMALPEIQALQGRIGVGVEEALRLHASRESALIAGAATERAGAA